ncbi:MAG: carbohydrate porin [Cyclobacteriaceae bacterium]
MKKTLTLAIFLVYSFFGFTQTDEVRFAEFEVVYSALPWVNTTGGVDQGFVYIDNLDITATLNFSHLFNWDESLLLFVYVLGNHGGKATSLMGDFQAASNIEAPKSWRLFETWVQQNFFNDRISVLGGLYDLNSEFDVLSPGLLFINSSFGIGAEYAQSGTNGPSIFPVSSLAVRISSVLSSRVKLKLAVLDAVPGEPNRLSSNKVILNRSEGVLFAFESSYHFNNIDKRAKDRQYVTRRKKVGRDHAITADDKINFGGWYYSAAQIQLSDSLPSKGDWGAYVGIQKYWLRAGKGYTSCFARFGVANDRFNRFGSAISGGLVYSELSSKWEDQLGVAFSSGVNGKSYQKWYKPDARIETVLELTYAIHLLKWLMIQPDIQYVVNPNTEQGLSNPFAVSALVQISL